jgi:hypothetical protein
MALSVSAFFLLTSNKQAVSNPPETYKVESTSKVKSIDSSDHGEQSQHKQLVINHQ